jgi:cholesterol transport system auxiliary component
VRSPPASRHALLLPCLLLSGCTGLFHSDARPEQTYYLRAAGAEASADSTGGAVNDSASSGTVTPATGLSLRVGHISAGPGLESPHIMLVQPDHRMNFYSGSRWPAPAPELIEALAVQTLRASGAWSSVEDSASPFPSEYLLQVALLRFEADYTGGAAAAPVVHVVLDCIMGRREGRDVVATFVASASAPAAANRLAEVVAAFEQATTSALGELAQQSSQAERADAQQRSAQNAANPDASIRR